MYNQVTVLYVDDEPINLKLFAINFKNKYSIITAESGFDALEKLKIHVETQVVISDMKMPGMNGIEFIKIAKKNYPKITFFILTGYDITPEITQALKENFIYQYFQKPSNMKEIEMAINCSLEKI